jgi:hypothetical protein
MRITLAIVILAIGIAACGGGGSDPDAHINTVDARTGCEPLALLPTEFRPIAEVSAGLVDVTLSGGIWSGTIDATAGGTGQSADNPYIYVDLRSGAKVAVDDIQASTSQDWDIALKRYSLRSNGGDSGEGMRSISVVTEASLDLVTEAPAAGYVVDNFVDDSCTYIPLMIGEPSSAFGQWYDYDDATHVVTPKAEVYVIERGDGTHTAFRVVDYYGDPAMPMRGAYYQVEWKDL